MQRRDSTGPARIVPGPPTDTRWAEIEEIFFLSAGRQDFADAAAKRDFFEKWTGYYRRYEPKLTFVALDPDGRVAGYLTGCADSSGIEHLYRDIPHYGLFEDQFDLYPAHFHINCHPDRRGRGIGAALVAAFFDDCVATGRPGVHIVTDPKARNVGFYRDRGMDVSIRRRAGGRDLLFIGTALAAG